MATCMPTCDSEEWRDIGGYEGLYQISNSGLVKSLSKKIVRKNGFVQTFKARILKPNSSLNYDTVALSKGGVVKTFYVHKLVADAFVLNPNGLPEINHKDENARNNNASNLEWVTHRDNLNYGTHNQKISIKNSCPICSIADDGTITKYPSITFASKHFGVTIQAISNAIRKGNKSNGLKWRYAV